MIKRLILSFLVLTSINFSQSLLDKCTMYSSKISIGSDANEVKGILGKPFAVEIGFPDNNNCLPIIDLPEFKGQLNYSTWIYKFNSFSYKGEGVKYFLNDYEVSEDMYKGYEKSDSCYVKLNGQLILPRSLKTHQLMGTTLKAEKIEQRSEKTFPKTYKFQPIVFVIFERGTSVVAEVRTNFLIL